ncbi:hypothetical protein ES288_A02G047900v1 [Gossypium darwinii]|uniref:Uncharacterized protein n=1 Tax=Gossypium darwinii TaxID=34276 RepID=A0A5D2HC72_GOSDA|nr:hypothetical protein ES288_A02G047900v1 [Gossypium darwinii]
MGRVAAPEGGAFLGLRTREKRPHFPFGNQSLRRSRDSDDRLRASGVFRGSTNKGGQPFAVSVKWRQEGQASGLESMGRGIGDVIEEGYGVHGH